MSSENRLVRPAGSRKKRPTANSSANTIVPAQAPPPMSCCLPASSGGICALADMPSARNPILSDSPSATTPRTTGTRRSRWRFVQETSGSEITSISPFAPSFESGPPAASCSGDGLRTATAQVEMPRIITPSRTACPPIGASFVASLRWSLTSPMVSARAPPALAGGQVGAGELAGVVALSRLHDQPVGIHLDLHRADTRRPVDHHDLTRGGRQRRDHHGVHDRAVDGQPHRHAGRGGDSLVG